MDLVAYRAALIEAVEALNAHRNGTADDDAVKAEIDRAFNTLASEALMTAQAAGAAERAAASRRATFASLNNLLGQLHGHARDALTARGTISEQWIDPNTILRYFDQFAASHTGN
jgi:hypothetical protein